MRRRRRLTVVPMRSTEFENQKTSKTESGEVMEYMMERAAATTSFQASTLNRDSAGSEGWVCEGCEAGGGKWGRWWCDQVMSSWLYCVAPCTQLSPALPPAVC